MEIDINKVIDIQAQRHGIDKAKDSKEIAIILAENQALKEEIEQLKSQIDELTKQNAE